MSTTVMSAALLARVLAPVFKDLYSGAKGEVQKSLHKISTVAGVKKLATTLAKLDKVKTIWSADEDVSIHKFYYPSSLSIEGNNILVESTNDLPEGNIVIQGIVGQGKSIFMRHLACSLLTAPGMPSIPFLFELRNISSKRTVQDCINSFLITIGMTGGEETFNYLASTGRIVLLLDGFDEVPESCVADTLVEIDVMQVRFPDLKIIVSSRPQNQVQQIVGFKVLNLVPLTPDDYDAFVRKLIPSAAKRNDVVSALNSCPSNIVGIISTPLMLTLVIIVYQTEKEIPESLSDFFDKLFGIVFTKHDKLKAGFNRQHYSGLPERKLRALFDAFCFMVIQLGGGRTLAPRLFNKAFDGALMLSKGCECELEDFRKDIIQVACLLVEEGIDLTTFLHKGLLDYHAAAFVKDLPEVRAKTFYSAAVLEFNKWKYPLDFLQVIDLPRYAEYYYLASFVVPHQVLSRLLVEFNDRDLLGYILKSLPDFEIGVNGKRLASWGPQRRGKAEIEEQIHDAIVNFTIGSFEMLSGPALERLLLKSSPGRNKKSQLRHISLSNLVEEFGVDGYRRRLSQTENSIYQRIENYRSVIAGEATQETIFDDLLNLAPSDRKGERVSRRRAPRK
ncbi:NACHT domain-containing protein [Pseudomonas syringae]|uniref:NACHT domain-containing protein n=1 Tax=Pseudomonas syringae TaxID=317 RepID=UPI003CF01EC4